MNRPSPPVGVTRVTRLTRLTRHALVAFAVACVGCPGSLEDPARFSDAAASCPDVPQNVFAAVCSSPGCHNATDKMLGLDLQSPGVASRLVGVSATGGSGLLVDPNDPPMSVLYAKLTAAPPYGVRMPFGEKPLDDATIACVLDWITTQVSDGGSDDGTIASGDASGDDGPADDAGPGTPVNDAAADGGPTDAAMVPGARPVVRDASSPPPPSDAGSSPTADASIRDASPD